MSRVLTVSPAPHLAHGDTTSQIMYDVALALLPTTLFGAYLFGVRALVICALSILSALVCEWGYEKLLHRPVTVSDGSALVTGLLVGLNLPVAVPLWLPVVGSAFAILLVKQLFGGLGKNFMNPAMAARVFLSISFPVLMTNYTLQQATFSILPLGTPAVDGVSAATPLWHMVQDDIYNPLFGSWQGPRRSLVLGFVPGCIGEVGNIALLTGGIYLLLRKVITWQIPVSYLGTVALLTYLFPQMGADPLTSMLCHLCAGGLMLGAFFMATDYVTSPVTSAGRLIYGVGCGVLTVVFRYFGAFAEGVSFAILIMNLLVPYLDRLCRRRVFGTRQKKGVSA